MDEEDVVEVADEQVGAGVEEAGSGQALVQHDLGQQQLLCVPHLDGSVSAENTTTEIH